VREPWTVLSTKGSLGALGLSAHSISLFVARDFFFFGAHLCRRSKRRLTQYFGSMAIIIAIQASKGTRTVFDEVISTQISEADAMKTIESGAEKVTSIRR